MRVPARGRPIEREPGQRGEARHDDAEPTAHAPGSSITRLHTPFRGLILIRGHLIANFPIFHRFFLMFRTFLGDFTPDRLDSRSLRTLWEWKNRVLLEEYHIFYVAIPLEVE